MRRCNFYWWRSRRYLIFVSFRIINNKNRVMNQEPNENSKTTASQDQLMHIKLTFGDDSLSKQLFKVSLTFEMGKQDEELRKQIKEKENNGMENDCFIKIKFNVAEGREKQAIEYLQRSVDESDKHQRKSLNYIQTMLHDPGRYGVVYFKSSEKKDGKVNVYYVLYDEMMSENVQQKLFYLANFCQNHPRLDINFFVKGQQMKDFDDKTFIQPSYSQLNLKVLTTTQQIVQMLVSVYDELKNNPLLNIIGRGIKKITFKTKMNIFQKIIKLYNDIVDSYEDHKYEDQEVKCTNLLKKEIELIISWKKIGLLKVKIEFSKEQNLHFMLNKIMAIMMNFGDNRD